MIWSRRKKRAAASVRDPGFNVAGAAANNPKLPTDGEKEACKTYLEQTKLLVTLSSAFLIAPAGLVSFFSERVGVGIGSSGLNLLVGAESCFVASVLAGYVVLATLSGSQHLNKFDVFRPATRWSSISQLGCYIAGLFLFVLLARTLFVSAAAEQQPHTPTRSVAPAVVLPPAAVEKPLAIYSFWFDLASRPTVRGKGVTLPTEQRHALNLIMKGLEACSGMGKGEKVEIGFRGFADPNLFRVDHAELNREIARRRATELRRLVLNDLSIAKSLGSVVVRDTVMWSSEQEMTTAVGYIVTRPLSETGPHIDQGQWDRRADLVVWRLGTCSMAPVASESK